MLNLDKFHGLEELPNCLLLLLTLEISRRIWIWLRLKLRGCHDCHEVLEFRMLVPFLLLVFWCYWCRTALTPLASSFLLLVVPYCAILHPYVIVHAELDEKVYQMNSIGAGNARGFFSYLENAIEETMTGDNDPFDEYIESEGIKSSKLSKAEFLTRKPVILFPSPSFLLGQVGKHKDIRPKLCKVSREDNQVVTEIRTFLGQVSAIFKVDKLIKEEAGESTKLSVQPKMTKTYTISGQKRFNSFSVLSWKTPRTDVSYCDYTYIRVIDNRPLAVLVSWFEDEKGCQVTMADFDHQYRMYKQTLGHLIDVHGLSDHVYFHEFDGLFSDPSSLSKLVEDVQKNEGRN